MNKGSSIASSSPPGAGTSKFAFDGKKAALTGRRDSSSSLPYYQGWINRKGAAHASSYATGRRGNLTEERAKALLQQSRKRSDPGFAQNLPNASMIPDSNQIELHSRKGYHQQQIHRRRELSEFPDNVSFRSASRTCAAYEMDGSSSIRGENRLSRTLKKPSSDEVILDRSAKD
ncbi:hypothetical protein IE53DRAFT_370820 [Violaceomyces palustris]|uniref:Uncharacterized protein n=1 Tax=Violaceomyces palustris TaxID=1673888 RepID=A0ACD0NR27_9BASI|nr:hypothetical protein IE53DRAFT_370820 [Violaceomyces palustris]